MEDWFLYFLPRFILSVLKKIYKKKIKIIIIKILITCSKVYRILIRSNIFLMSIFFLIQLFLLSYLVKLPFDFTKIKETDRNKDTYLEKITEILDENNLMRKAISEVSFYPRYRLI